MTISEQGMALIKAFEGCQLKAYQDSVGVWTLGWGAIRQLDNTPIKEGDTWTQEEADQALRVQVEEEGCKYVRAFCEEPLNQNQFDALSSFTYNRGAGRLKQMLGMAGPVADNILVYDWAGADRKVLPGLTRRRRAEREMYLGGDWRKFT